jgi:capsular polysaccharide biosynthesis protein
LISADIGKQNVAGQMLARAGIGVNPWSYGVQAALDEAIELLGRSNNIEIDISPPQVSHIEYVHTPDDRTIMSPIHLNERPSYYPSSDDPRWPAHETAFGYLEVPFGFVGVAPDMPVVFDGDSRLIEAVGSRYKKTIYQSDFPVLERLRRAEYVNADAIVILDDIFDLNFCHWLSDWLPRLEFLNSTFPQRRFKVVTNRLTSNFQVETLSALGFSRDDVLELDRGSCLQFRSLIVPNDLGMINHPAHKGAPWAVDFLRSMELPRARTGLDRIFVNRNDAAGRRIAGGEALEAALSKLGFVSISLSGRPFFEQAALFRDAKRVVGIHGAGLTNLIYSNSDAKLIELTPATYGMPTFAILAGARDIPFATYLCEASPRGNPSLDDLILDVDHFVERAAEFLR